MKQLIAEQLQFILLMTVGGMGLMLAYDAFRLFRWLIPHASLFIVIEDLLYWSVMSVPIFYLFLLYHDGIIRWYGVVSLFTGIVLYELGLSRPIRTLLAGILNPWRRKILGKMHKIRKKIMVKMKQMSIKCRKNIAQSRRRVYNKRTNEKSKDFA